MGLVLAYVFHPKGLSIEVAGFYGIPIGYGEPAESRSCRQDRDVAAQAASNQQYPGPGDLGLLLRRNKPPVLFGQLLVFLYHSPTHLTSLWPSKPEVPSDTSPIGYPT